MSGNQMWNKAERFFRQHAIRNLSLYIVLCYGFGYLLYYVNASFLDYLTLNPYAILHGQIWRLVTWVLVPPSSSNIFYVLIAMLFYYSIGTALEKTWGTYNYNVYIFGGMLMTIIGAFVVMIVSYLLYGEFLMSGGASFWFEYTSLYFSTYYVTMSIFLAYAATFPNNVVLFMFILPVKVKWLGIIYGIILAYDFLSAAWNGLWFYCIAMAASLANFLIFVLRSRKLDRFNPKEVKRRSDFRKAMNGGKKSGFFGRFSDAKTSSGLNNDPAGTSSGTAQRMRPSGEARHRCAICGRTELDDPTLEFRYCSRCIIGYEFCQDHLFHHEHATVDHPPKALDG